MTEHEIRQVHWCRMWMLAIAILHWIVFYLLTQTSSTAASGTGTRLRSSFASTLGIPGSVGRQSEVLAIGRQLQIWLPDTNPSSPGTP
jgi:thiosulfate reductase cytochrome b subunit